MSKTMYISPYIQHRSSYLRYIFEMERIVEEVISGCFPKTWDEDHISFSLCERLGALRLMPSNDISPLRVDWDVLKLRGDVEQRFGDIGFIVEISSSDSQSLLGVALFEAKKKDRAKGTYLAYRYRQLQRIFRNAPYSHLLLYDYEPTRCFEDNLLPYFAFFQMYTSIGFQPMFDTNAVNMMIESKAICVPACLALHLKKCDESLYKYSLPFSLQISCRFLRGYDLHFDKKVVDAVGGFNKSLGGPAFLFRTGISTIGKKPTLPTKFNENLYEPITEPPL